MNRLTSPGDDVAVELMAKTPYLSVDVHDLEAFTWTLPDATTARPFTAGLERSVPRSGESVLLLSGPREDVTAKIMDSSASTSLSYDPRSGPTDPIEVGYDCTGGSTGKFAFTRVDAATGALVNSYLESCLGVTDIAASGRESSFIDVTASMSQDRVFYETMDAGTALHLDAEDVPTRFKADMKRGDCGTTSQDSLSVSTLGTGQAGKTLVQIGDGGRVPASRGGDYVDMRCQGGNAHSGMRMPYVRDMRMEKEEECGGFSVQDVPSNTVVNMHHEDNTGTYDIYIEGQEPGFLDLELDCNRLEYWFNNVLDQPTRIVDVRMDYERTQAACIEFDEQCVNKIDFDGEDLPPTALAEFKGPDPDQKFLRLIGDAGGLLDLQFVLDGMKGTNGQQDEPLDFLIKSSMPLGYLEFEKTDQNGNTKYDQASNMVTHIDDGSEDTLFVKVENLDFIEVRIDTMDGFELKADYDGSSGEELVYHSVQVGKEQRAELSNLPSHLQDLDIKIPEGPDECQEVGEDEEKPPLGPIDITANANSRIDLFEYVFILAESGCEGEDGQEWFNAEVEGVPAGELDIHMFIHGSAGNIRATSSGGAVDHVVVKKTNGNPKDYIDIDVSNVKLTADWDLDGAKKYFNSPAYAFIDSVGLVMIGHINLRSDDSGFFLESNHMMFDDLQLKRGTKVVPLPVAPYVAPIPWIFKTGDADFEGTAKYINENGKTRKIPNWLLNNEE